MTRMLRGSLAIVAALIGCGPAQAAWQVATSRHFVVYADDTPEHVRAYTTRLERFDKAVRVLHNTPDDPRGAASRVTIFALTDIGDVQRLRHNDHIAGFWVPAIHPIAFMPRTGGGGGEYGLSAQAILFHEYTHHWMLTSWSDAAFPAWYAEGMAELHATAIMRPDGGVVFGAEPAYRRFGVGLGATLPVPRLLRAVPGKLTDEQEAALYGRGWLLTDYLFFDDARRKQLADYIVAINSGKQAEDAGQVFGNLTTLDLKLDGWAKRPSLPSIGFDAGRLPIGDVEVRALSAGEAAAIPARIRSSAGVDKSQAPAVVALARAAGAAFPNDPAVQNELAEAEYDAATLGSEDGRVAGLARAEAAADRAIAADPHSVHALVYKGMAEQARALAEKKTDAATWQAIRHCYVLANKADTEDPEPLVLFYESFTAVGQAPGKSAQDGLLYAYALAPHAAEIRLLAGTVLLAQGQAAAARIAIAPVAYNAEAGDAATHARAVLDALDKDGAPAALAVLHQQEQDAKTKTAKAG